MTAANGAETRSPYATREYASAFGLDFLEVPEWRTPVLVRPIPNSLWCDALGCYPLAALARGADLKGGLDRLRSADLVSVALVPDPLTGPPLKALRTTFEVCERFKTHFTIDRTLPIQIAKTHRQMVRKAFGECRIGPVDFHAMLAEWSDLHSQTASRHGITGIQDFSTDYFRSLARMPACLALGAFKDGRAVAMALWIDDGEIVYYHLAASSTEGYKAQAMYGIVAAAIEHFADARVIELGGAAGASASVESGLAYFKRGFANREITTYFCGSCLHADRYAALSAKLPASSFYPAYRQPS